MSGKKVFTHAGELLATFFSTKRKTDILASKQEQILKYLGKSEILSPTEINLDEFQKQYELNKIQTMEEIDNNVFKKFENYKITDGVKEVPVNDMVQRLYHDVKNLDAITQAQFKALSSFFSTKVAEQIKKSSEQYRQFSYEITNNNNNISNFLTRPLDYFVGGDNDKKRIYYKFSGNRLLVANGNKDDQQWIEVFRMDSTSDKGQAVASGNFMIGGSSGDKISEVSITKATNINGDLKVTNGEIYGIVTNARYADLAEYYTSNVKFPAGTLVGINSVKSNDDSKTYDENKPDTIGEIQIHDCSSEFLGVVSSKPGFTLNKPFNLSSDGSLENKLWAVPIVLTGRSPIKLISKGQRGHSVYVPINCPGSNFEEREFLKGKALVFSKGEYLEYLKFNKPLQKIGTLLYDAVEDEEITTEEFGLRKSYIGIAKIN